jgi:glutamate synthase (NADPH/NADH) small chain
MDVLNRVPVREQEPQVRAANFEEVCLGYNEEEAKAEAARCLNCKNAQCMKGCPVSINIPAFIAQVKEGNFEEAYHIISQSSALPAICPLSADVSARRRASVKENVSAESRVNRLQSVN